MLVECSFDIIKNLYKSDEKQELVSNFEKDNPNCKVYHKNFEQMCHIVLNKNTKSDIILTVMRFGGFV